MTVLEKFLKELAAKNDILSYKDLDQFKRQASARFKIPMVKNAELLAVYKDLRAKNQLVQNKILETLLTKRRIRTLSGVAPIAVLTKPSPCPGNCLFCPQEKNMPKSYLSNEPAVMRAVKTKFDPYIQVKVRLKALHDNGHDTDKIELIVMGGTWSCFPPAYKFWFLKRCFDACNDGVTRVTKGSSNLAKAQKKNEKALHRIVGLTLETRPDYVTDNEVKQMRILGCTRVEMGVQHTDEKVLKFNRRGHTIKQVIEATRRLKEAGFKVSYHIMPNLPTSTVQKDFLMFHKLFLTSDFQPDMLKIYPCVVVKGAQLYKLFLQKKYRPYTDKQLFELLLKIKKTVPAYVRISRLIRDIPENSIVGGNKRSNLREILQAALKQKGFACQCLRCREARLQINSENFILDVINYPASQGQEYFLQCCSVDKKILYAFCRLRINTKKNLLFPELNGAALIRELHTYGQLMPLLKGKNSLIQHSGFGKKLMQAAEKIARDQGILKMAVIAGVGVRPYYRKLGYRLQGTYMIKIFK